MFRRLLFRFAPSLFQNGKPLPFNLVLYDEDGDLNSATENEKVVVLNKKKKPSKAAHKGVPSGCEVKVPFRIVPCLEKNSTGKSVEGWMLADIN